MELHVLTTKKIQHSQEHATVQVHIPGRVVKVSGDYLQITEIINFLTCHLWVVQLRKLLKSNSDFNFTVAKTPCDTNPCLNQGNCSVDPKNSTVRICKCPVIYTGKNCESKRYFFTLFQR